MRRHSIVGNYYRLDPRKRINVILYHFEGFPSIIRNYEMELEDWILDARARARRESLGDLGVRIQSGHMGSPTEGGAIERMTVEDIIKNGALDHYCMSLDSADEIRIIPIQGLLMAEDLTSNAFGGIAQTPFRVIVPAGDSRYFTNI